LAEAAALGVELLALGLELAHARDRRFERRARVADALLRFLERLRELREFGVDAREPALGRFEPALLALQLAREFGHAAVREVQRTLRVLALLLGLEQAVLERDDLLVDPGFAPRERLDLGAQRLDLALAHQRARL